MLSQERLKSQMNVWYPIDIRFRDLDPLAHVNNTVYFTYYEEARSYYFEQLLNWLERWPNQEEDQDVVHPLEELGAHTARIQTTSIGSHYGILIKENKCVYNLPLIREDKAEIGVHVIKLGRTSIIMELTVRDMADTSRVFATGSTVMVWCNYHTGRPSPIPPTLRSAIEHLEEMAFPVPE